MLRADRIEREIRELAAADADVALEIHLRRALIVMAGIGMWISLGGLIFLIWGLGYAFADIFYVWFVKRAKEHATLDNLFIALILSLAIGLWIGGMAVHMTMMEDGAYYFPGACIVVGLALHCLASHAQFSAAAFIDLTTVTLTNAGIVLCTAHNAESAGLSFSIVVGGVAIMIYFAHSLRKMILQRIELARRMELEQQGEKMRALGQLTSGVAHDFNNLLTVIGGNIELAQLHDLSEDTREVLGEAHRASNSAALLVSQLMAYARKSTLRIQTHPCDAVFAQTGGIARRVLPANIVFEVVLPGPDTMIETDAALLEAALLNLIVNARDAIGGSDGHVSLFARSHPEEGVVDLIVTDTGPGMSPDSLAKATEPFFTTKGVGEGSGLGLSMVKGFAEQSGGRFTLENRSDGGMRATLTVLAGKTGDAPERAAGPGPDLSPAQ